MRSTVTLKVKFNLEKVTLISLSSLHVTQNKHISHATYKRMKSSISPESQPKEIDTVAKKSVFRNSDIISILSNASDYTVLWKAIDPCIWTIIVFALENNLKSGTPKNNNSKIFFGYHFLFIYFFFFRFHCLFSKVKTRIVWMLWASVLFTKN